MSGMQLIMMACQSRSNSNYSLQNVSYVQSFDFSSYYYEIFSIWISHDGNYVFVTGNITGEGIYIVKRFTMSTPWDISTITGPDTDQVISGGSSLYYSQCIFDETGIDLYIYDAFNSHWRYYTSASAYSIDLPLYNGNQSFSLLNLAGRPIFVNKTISNIYGPTSLDETHVSRSVLSTPGDFTTAGSITTMADYSKSPLLNPSLNKMIILDDSGATKYLKEYSLSGGDLSTASYVRSYTLSGVENNVSFGNSGQILYTISSLTLKQYSLV